MRIKLWVCLWCAIAAACIIGGLVTRASFTALDPGKTEVLNSYYMYDDLANSQDFQKVSYKNLASSSALVVTCRFDGKREIQNECYLTEVQVTSVIKGDKSLNNQKIKVYEPVWTRYEDISFMKNAPGFDFKSTSKSFGWQGKNRIVVSQPWSVKNLYYTLMAKDNNYLLFLNQRERLPEQDQVGRPNYVMLDSVYGRVALSCTTAADYKKPPYSISVGNSIKYEILLTDPNCIKAYFDTKAAILKELHLQ